MFVKPAPRVNVRDPVSKQHLPLEGAEVPDSSYWVRCLKSGDVVICSPTVVGSRQIPDSKGEE